MNYFHFFLSNKRLISFGFILAFFSSFGQTFLISLYVPSLMQEFHLTGFSFGMIFGAATILSGLALSWAGKFIDHCHLREYTLVAVGLLVISCLMIGFALNFVWVFAGIWGLRLAGQGLLTHISNTSIAKFFHHTRGMALSLCALGYAMGEALFPMIVGSMIGLMGWRRSMISSAGLIAVILVPFIYAALDDKRLPLLAQQTTRDSSPKFSLRGLLGDQRFYIITLNSFILPSTITGLFFYQLILAQEKGWSVEWLSLSFLGFALGRTFFSLFSGPWVDRFGALKLFPLYLIPFFIGLLLLTFGRHPIIALLYLTLTGITVGISMTVKTALLTEIYGTQNLGRIRAIFATMMVLSTALSPAIFGLIIDAGWGFSWITGGSAILVLLSILLSLRLEGTFQKPPGVSEALPPVNA